MQGNDALGRKITNFSRRSRSERLRYYDSVTLSDQVAMSESTLKVGKKGEIFTNAELRRRAHIKEGGLVNARIVDDKLVIEAIPSIAELLKQPLTKSTTKEMEELSEQFQKEEGIYD